MCAGSGRSAQLKKTHMEKKHQTETERWTKTVFSWISYTTLIWIVNMVWGKQNCSFILWFAIYFHSFPCISKLKLHAALGFSWPLDELGKKLRTEYNKSWRQSASKEQVQHNVSQKAGTCTDQSIQKIRIYPLNVNTSCSCSTLKVFSDDEMKQKQKNLNSTISLWFKKRAGHK